MKIWDTETWIMAEASKCKTSSSLSQLQRLALLASKIDSLQVELENTKCECQANAVETECRRLEASTRSLDDTTNILLLEHESNTKSVLFLKQSIDERKDTLHTGRLEWEQTKRDLDNRTDVEQKTRQLNTLEHSIHRRQAELICDLAGIYPIRLSNPPTIRFLPVPSSATALGYTAHVVSLLAFYLDTLLWYPLKLQGSTSSAVDPINEVYQPNPFFPLYKTQDVFRWEYGVYLLNKDIEQLLNVLQVDGYKLRDTLPNLRKVLVSMAKRGDLEDELLEAFE